MRRLLLLILLWPQFALAQSFGPITSPYINHTWYVGSVLYPTFQSAVTAACASSAGGTVLNVLGAAPSDSPSAVTGGCTKVQILDAGTALNINYYYWSNNAYAAFPALFGGGILTSQQAALNGGGSLTGTFNGSPTFAGTPTFSGTPVFQAGASLAGTFTGNPTFSGSPTFSGPVKLAGAQVQGYVLPNYTTATWVKLGTWVSNTAALTDTLRINFDSGNGDATNSGQQATSTLVMRSGNTATAPNLSGLSVINIGGSFPNQPITAAVAVATGNSTSAANQSWDVYIQVPLSGGGQYFVTTLSTDTWTNLLTTGTTPPTTASSSVVPGFVSQPIDYQGRVFAPIYTEAVINSPGMQLTQNTGCTFSSGAIGTTCSTTATLPVVPVDVNFFPICDLFQASAGTVLGSDSAHTISGGNATFVISSYAITTASTGGGTLRCLVFHY